MIRRLARTAGPFEFRPVPLASIMTLFYVVYVLGVYNAHYMIDRSFNLRGAIPAVISGVAVGLVAWVARRVQQRRGVTWPGYLISIAIMALIVPTTRALLDFVPQLPAGSQAYPITVLRSFIALWFVTAVLGSITTRLAQQARDTEVALRLAREQQVQIIAADEEARRQVSLVLHDRVQAGLITSCLELQALSADLDERSRARLEPMIGRLEQMRTFDVRGAARVLSPNLEEIDLQTALEELALQFEAVIAIDVDVDEAMDLDRSVLGSGLPLAVYRIVEQALLNAVVHASATRIDVRVTRTPVGCTVTIADDGVGVSPEAEGGLGSTLVTTWTRAMQGEWHWEAGREGRGTTLVAELKAVELNA